MGVRPSLDGRAVVAEKCRVSIKAPGLVFVEGVRVWKAGTRKQGRMTVEVFDVDIAAAELSALSRSRTRPGASILGVGTVSIGCAPTISGRWAGPRIASKKDSSEKVRVIPSGSGGP